MDMFTPISSKTVPFDSRDNTRVHGDASFSSCLNNGKDDGFIRKLSESTRYLNANSGGVEDGEIGVFRAEKYFNGGIKDDEGSQRSTSSGGTRKPPADQSKKVDKLVLGRNHHHHHQPRPWLGTPSVGSESSSINSQRPLLKNMARNTASAAAATTANNNFIPSKSNYLLEETATSRSFLSTTLGYCKCYSCKDKDCVDVGEISFSNAVDTKPRKNNNNKIMKCVEEGVVSSGESFRENHFSFPTGSLLMSPPVKVIHNFKEEEEVERKSLEVFGSPLMGRLRNFKQLSLEKRVAMLSWDQTNNNSSGGIIYTEDEVNSDCSSDLFEIESLTKIAANSFLQSPTTCYAPSEASVEWSVATASALDFDFDDRRPSSSSPARVVKKLELEVVQKRRSNSLLGCKSDKAVKVAEINCCKTATAKSNYDHLRCKSESSVPMKKFEEGGFSFRSQGPPPPQRALATRSLPRPYSPRLSNILFNIH